MKKAVIISGIILVALLTMSISGHKKHIHLFEQPIQVEKWMTHPFDTIFEETIEIEEWMTKPFLTA